MEKSLLWMIPQKKAIDTFIKIGNQLSDREEERLRAYAKQLVERKQ